MKMEKKIFSSSRRRSRYVGEAKNGKLNKFSFFFLGKSFRFNKVGNAHVHLININFYFSLENFLVERLCKFKANVRKVKVLKWQN